MQIQKNKEDFLVPTDKTETISLARRVSWASLAFYALIASEFFYMASPFAAYFYGVYGPGLDIMGSSPTASWLVSFFMPHIVAETKSTFINGHNLVGGLLFSIGLTGFAIGVFQIYRSKLQRSKAVEGGIYRWVRHPQYLALFLASLGMLLIWPRFLVLVGFVTVLFVYILLARAEERLCTRLYPGYAECMQRTGMFLPRICEAPFRSVPMPQQNVARIFTWLGLYAVTMAAFIFAGTAIKSHSIDSLYAHYTDDIAYVSVGELPANDIAGIAGISLASPEVVMKLQMAGMGNEARFIAYVLPTELHISEIPMHLPKGVITTHTFPDDHDVNRYKIIFARAHLAPGSNPAGKDILVKALNKYPVIEVWIDRGLDKVERIFQPPEKTFYNNMPVPLF